MIFLFLQHSAGICPWGSFLCSNGNCISPLLKCDGEDNCGDGSDEVDQDCIPGNMIKDKYKTYHSYINKIYQGMQ